MLTGFSVDGSLELLIPESCSMTLLTAACYSPANISLQLRHEEQFVAVITGSMATASLQYPLTHRDSPVVIQTDAKCHFVAAISGSESLDSFLVSAKEQACPETSVTEEAVVESGPAMSKSRKRRLRSDERLAEEPSEETLMAGKEIASAPIEVPPVPSVVVAIPRPDTTKRKRWKVRPPNEDVGILVPSPKQVIKGSGVVITDYIVGKSKAPRLGSKVRVIYQAMFPDGKVFDEHLSTKQPFVFRLGAAQVIRGLDLGMEGMRIGGAREIVIPPEFGYVTLRHLP